MNAIEIKDLTKKYRDTVAVNSLSLDIKEGELFSLLGINGAGKSTTIKMLSCLTIPTAGDAEILGKSVTEKPDEVRAIIGISPQETAVAMGLSVRENLQLLCGIHGFSKEKTSKKIGELSEALSLGAVLDKRASKLSGGYQRRLSIALSLIGEPKILFLDEPTLGLDVIARSELWDVIRSLKGKMTVILTTHYMEEAESLSDRIGIMRSGELVALGTADELKEKAGCEKFEDAFIKLARGSSK
ncbi:MAG: ATP-binding cassette domain-containing protein [Clostridia bacterium]|nr:ATP-binding cassette domain-containing protein [Clostridia bacterium]